MLKHTLLILGSLIVGLCVGLTACHYMHVTPHTAATDVRNTPLMTATDPTQPPGVRVIPVGHTPEGVYIYRLEGPDMIIPAVVAVSPSGAVAFR